MKCTVGLVFIVNGAPQDVHVCMYVCMYVGQLPNSPGGFELVDMGLNSATFSWLSDMHTDDSQTTTTYRLHYKSLSADHEDYRLIEVWLYRIVSQSLQYCTGCLPGSTCSKIDSDYRFSHTHIPLGGGLTTLIQTGPLAGFRRECEEESP